MVDFIVATWGGGAIYLSGRMHCGTLESVMNRDSLHNLIDRIPDSEVPAARRFLEYLAVSPVYRAAQLAPDDDEPVTAADAESIARARLDIEAGRVTKHEEVLREFGSR